MNSRIALCLLALLWLAARPVSAQDAQALKGVALVVGQSQYRHLPALANTGNDARAVTQLLTGLGFDARSVTDRDAIKLKRDLERFAEDAEGADVASLYYSGHGIEAGGENYLLPVDADLDALGNATERL
ncbi:MAG: caspase domain-containing protein, partial [Parvibaculaceae bacterium]